MDKNLLRDAQLKIADARGCIQAVFDDVSEQDEPGEKAELLEEILGTLDELDTSIEKLMTEQQIKAQQVEEH